MKFENISILVPVGYKEVVSKMYEDYLTPRKKDGHNEIKRQDKYLAK